MQSSRPEVPETLPPKVPKPQATANHCANCRAAVNSSDGHLVTLLYTLIYAYVFQIEYTIVVYEHTLSLCTTNRVFEMVDNC